MSNPPITLDQNNTWMSLRKIITGNLPAYLSLLVVIGVMILRDTHFFSQPRFWAEEGTLHFAYSYSHNWFSALFQPQVGYLNFWPNLATLLATLVPLEFAPLVTTLMGFIVQIIPVILILWSRTPLWRNWATRLAGAAIIVFVPLSNEVWLNSVNSYNYFAIIAFLILLDDSPVSQIRRWIYRALLGFGALSGTLTCFLISLFLYRAVLEKDRERWMHVIGLSVFTVIQIGLIFTYQSNARFGDRLHIIGLTTLGVTLWMQTLALFAAGLENARVWSQDIYSMANHNFSGFQTMGKLLIVGGTALFLLLSKNLSWKPRILFLGSFAILLYLPMMFSVITDKYAFFQTGTHQRIFLAPNTIFGLMLLLSIQFVPGKHWRAWLTNLVGILSVGLLGLALFWGIRSYQSPWFVNNYWPDWKTEVQKWRANPDYNLQIQPEQWVIHLPNR